MIWRVKGNGRLNGKIGKEICRTRSMVGLDFIDAEITGGANFLHDLKGRLTTHTGFFVYPTDLVPAKNEIAKLFL